MDLNIPKSNILTESSQICFRLAEEIRQLRQEILTLKEEKKSWLIRNQQSLAEVTEKCVIINSLNLEVSQLTDEVLSAKSMLKSLVSFCTIFINFQ